MILYYQASLPANAVQSAIVAYDHPSLASDARPLSDDCTVDVVLLLPVLTADGPAGLEEDLVPV